MLTDINQEQRQQYHQQPTCALQDFRRHMSSGMRLHNNRQFGAAIKQFQLAQGISRALIEKEPQMGYQCYLKLAVSAHHNLAASYSALGKLPQAERVLRTLHDTLMHLCSTPTLSRHLRAQALGALDNSLFALTNILGLQGKLCELFATIEATDTAAETAAAAILH